MTKPKYVTRKYNGDDRYSYAIFHAHKLRGVNGIIIDTPKPVISGLSKIEATEYKKYLESKDT